MRIEALQTFYQREMAAILADPGEGLTATPEAAELKGIGETPFEYWRLAGSAF